MSATPSWLAELLTDPAVTDLCLNGPSQAFADRGRGMEAVATDWDEAGLRAWVLDALSDCGKTWDARHPFVDATLASGHRLHVAFPPAAEAIHLSVRRLGSAARGRPEERWGGSPLFSRLQAIVRDGESIILSGATGSGKTTLANDLLAEVPASERILALEDTRELEPRHPHFVGMLSRPPSADGFGEVTLRTLLRQALRMRPDRIILGECRGAEVLDLLQALNTGHHGAMATLHANSSRDALRRLELLCLLAGGGAISTPAVRELIAVGVRWVAQVRREGAARKIVELARIEGREGDTILLRPVLD